MPRVRKNLTTFSVGNSSAASNRLTSLASRPGLSVSNRTAIGALANRARKTPAKKVVDRKPAKNDPKKKVVRVGKTKEEATIKVENLRTPSTATFVADTRFKPKKEVLPEFVAGNFAGQNLSIRTFSSVINNAAKSLPANQKDPIHFIADTALDQLRRTTPRVLPSKPVISGKKGASLPISSASLTRLIRHAAIKLCDNQTQVIWDDGVNQLHVNAGKVNAVLNDGQVRVEVPVFCDQVREVMRMPFAVGSEKRVSGMIMATADRPTGDALIARIWGDSLIALAYGALTEVIGSFAGASGRDEKNKRLVPHAVSAKRGQLTIETQARFRFKGLGQ